MQRWRLITLIVLLAVLGSVSALQHRIARSSPASGPTDVAIVQASSWPIPDAQVETLVRQTVTLAGGLSGIVEPGDTVVVKPNLVWGATPDEAYTTDPRVTRTVAQMAQEAGAGEVIIAEGSAVYRDGHDARGATVEAFHLCGYDTDGDMTDDATGAALIDLNDSGGLDQHDPSLVGSVHLQNGLIWSEYWLPNVILDADVLIGVPALKNHSSAGVTLALKNQIGIAPSDIYHKSGLQMYKSALGHGPDDLGRHIVDLNLARPLDFVIVDGLRGMTDGPTGGTPADPPMKLILAGRDAVAIDTIGALVMGYDPATIPYLGWAAGAGLGTNDVSQITVSGKRVSQVRRNFPAPYGDPQAQRADETAPSVSITAPGAGHVVAENTAVWVTASDNDAVTKVEFYVGEELQAIVTAPPYQATLDLSAYRGQSAALRAVAYDDALNDAEEEHTVTVVEAPAPGTASFQQAALIIPTYPYTDHLTTEYNPTYNMTYPVLDWDGYHDASTTPVEYELLILENDYLRVTLLPELGGRVYQMIYKPTGHNELYQNPVIKPNHWGPLEQGWWMAVGGIEWCLPVDEHGYEWGVPWSYDVITSTTGVTVTLRDTTASDRIRAAVTVHLPVDRAYLAITPHIESPTEQDIDYKYWSNAMLTPGAANTVGADLRFIFSADQMTVHSSGDDRVPPSGQVMDWPVHNSVDFSRLGNWDEWLGFFEYPQAQGGPQGGFIGVYDTTADEGVARVFPSDVAQGTKGFGMGWDHQIEPNIWTDGGSTYVELHGGIAPTFWDTTMLSAGQALEWTECWYPVSDIGILSAATAEGALGMSEISETLYIDVHTTTPRAAGASSLHVWDITSPSEIAHWDLPAVEPGGPFEVSVATGGRSLDEIAIMYLDGEGDLLVGVNAIEVVPVLTASYKTATPRLYLPDQTIAYTVVISNTGGVAVTATITDTPPVEMVVLTETLAATSGPTPTYASGQIRWSGTVNAGTEVHLTYVLSPTAAIPLGEPLTNTVEIDGGTSGSFTRQETVTKAYATWVPLALKNAPPTAP